REGLRLLLVPATPAPTPTAPNIAPAPEAPPAQAEAVPPSAESTTPATPSPSPATPPPVSTPAAAPSAWTISTPEPPVPEAPVRATPGVQSPLDWDIVPVAATGAALGLSA